MPKKISDAPTGTQFKDGAWYARYTYKGETIYEKCDNKTQARILYGKRKAEIRERRYFPKVQEAPKPKFSELAEQYRVYARNHHKRQDDDEHRIKAWEKFFGSKLAEEITEPMIEDVFLTWKEEGLKPATVDRRLTTLQAILNRAVEHNRITKNPILGVRAPEYDNTLDRALDAREEALLFKALPDRLKNIVRTALNTGCRQGELLKLTWADVDLKGKRFLCRDTKAQRRNRWVVMNSTVQTIFKALAPEDHNGADRVFKIDGGNLRRAFGKAVKDSCVSAPKLPLSRSKIATPEFPLKIPCRESDQESTVGVVLAFVFLIDSPLSSSV